MYNKKATYGSSLVLKTYMRKKFSYIPEDIIYFVTFQEFEKYMRLSSYGVTTPDIINDIMDDVKTFCLYYQEDYSDDLKNWMSVNFSHMESVIEEGLSNE